MIEKHDMIIGKNTLCFYMDNGTLSLVTFDTVTRKQTNRLRQFTTDIRPHDLANMFDTTIDMVG